MLSSLLLCLSLAVLLRESSSSFRNPPPPPVAVSDHGIVSLSHNLSALTTLRYTLANESPNARSGEYLALIALQSGGTVCAVAFWKHDTKREHGSEAVTLQVGRERERTALPSSLQEVTQDRDWPTYTWATRHKHLLAAPAAQLVFVGDSITQMWGGEPADRAQPGEDVWLRYYGNSRKVLNLGFGWDRTENCLWRMRHGELASSTESARLAVVLLGTNNLPREAGSTVEETAQGVLAVLEEIHGRLRNAHILVLAILPRHGLMEKVSRANTLIRAALSAAPWNGHRAATWLDLSASFVGPNGKHADGMLFDGVHPSAAGYEAMSAAIEPHVLHWLGEKVGGDEACRYTTESGMICGVGV